MSVGSNDTVVKSIAQKLVYSDKIKITLIQEIIIGRLIEINYFEEMQHY